MPRTLWLAILREVLLYSALGGIVVTFFFVAGNAPRYASDLVAVGFAGSDVLVLVETLAGIVATYSLPVAFLFGVLLTTGRMAADREVLAIAVCGLGRRSLLVPILGLGLVISGLTWVLANEVEHRARVNMRHLVRSLATRGIAIEAGGFVDLGRRVVSVNDRLTGDLLEGVMIYDRSNLERPLMIFAESGRFGFDEEANTFRFRLENGEVHVEEVRRNTEYKRVSFDAMEYSFDASEMFDVDPRRLRPYDMPGTQLRGIIAAADRGESLAEYARSERRFYDLELHRRHALPVAPLLFALVGVPLGVRVKRGSQSWGALLCGGLVLIYYLVLSFGRQLAESDLLAPGLAIWCPNVAFAILAVVLLRRRELFE